MALGCFMRKTNSTEGFTLIEILMVLVIVMVLATIALFNFSVLRTKVRTTRCMAEIRGIERDILAFVSEKDSYPADLSVLGLGALKDPWGNLYVYSPTTARISVTPLNTDFDLYSKGPTGDSTASVPSIQVGNGIDDIVRGDDGNFVGAAEDYMI